MNAISSSPAFLFSVKGTFHLLIPSSAWAWNDHCRLCVRHGYDETKKDFETIYPYSMRSF